MAKILFIPYAPQYGTFYGLLDLAKYFKDLGDEVAFAGDGKFVKVATNEGYNTFHLPEIPFDKYRKYVDHANLGMHNYKSLKTFVESELLLYNKFKPDLIITQARLSVPVSAKIANIPLISVTVPFLTEYFDFPKWIPETLNISFLKNVPILGNILANNIGSYLKSMAKVWIKPYNKLLSEYGIEKFNSLYDLYLGSEATLFPEDETLFPLSREHPDKRFIFTGPLLNFNHLGPPEWYNNVKDLDGKFIYLSMGSSSLTLYPILLEKLVRIYGNKPNYYVITNTTYTLSAKSKQDTLPSNFFITNLASAESLLALADITICHGGKGTVYHSIINAVPVLGIPQQAEQEMNLMRIRALHLGDYILSKEILKISDENLEELIEKILSDKQIRKNTNETSINVRKSMANIHEIINTIHNSLNEKK